MPGNLQTSDQYSILFLEKYTHQAHSIQYLLMKNLKRINLTVILLLFTTFLSSCIKKDNDHDNNLAVRDGLEHVCDSILQNTKITGMVAAVWAPEKDLEFFYINGVADIETKEPLDRSDYFRVGSNTKTMVVTRLLQLVDEGRVSLDDRLNKFFPDFPKSDSVTIEMLTNMTSGIFDYMDTDVFNDEMDHNPTRIWTKDELIDLVRNKEYHFEPGERFLYCNTNTQLIGRIIEMITGNPLQDEIIQHVFSPLHFENTTFPVSGITMPDPHPKGYFIGEFDPGYPEYSEHFDISWAQAAGCVISNIYDLKEYVIAINNGYYLSDSLQDLRINNRVPVKDFVYYAIGGFYLKGYFGHGGDIAGFSSAMFHSMEKNCTMIIWYNSLLNEVRPMHQVVKFDEIIFD